MYIGVERESELTKVPLPLKGPSTAIGVVGSGKAVVLAVGAETEVGSGGAEVGRNDEDSTARMTTGA